MYGAFAIFEVGTDAMKVLLVLVLIFSTIFEVGFHFSRINI